MALLDDFKARFPNIDSALADMLVPVYEDEYPCYYGGSYENECDKKAILYLIAFFVTTDPSYTGDDSPDKSISSQTVGSVSVSFSSGSSDSDWEDWLKSNKYGQRYLMLTSKNIGPTFA